MQTSIKSIGAHESAKSKSDIWLTPPEIIKALGPFDLDPCAYENQPWRTAEKQYTIWDNGLTQQWDGYVWLNPPYTEVGIWLDRLAQHGNGIALIFARTETKMFFRCVWEKAHAVRFIEGRLHFHHPDGRRAKSNAGAPSVLVAYGDEAANRIRDCSIPGRYIYL